jgi:hypothetical protein
MLKKTLLFAAVAIAVSALPALADNVYDLGPQAFSECTCSGQIKFSSDTFYNVPTGSAVVESDACAEGTPCEWHNTGNQPVLVVDYAFPANSICMNEFDGYLDFQLFTTEDVPNCEASPTPGCHAASYTYAVRVVPHNYKNCK